MTNRLAGEASPYLRAAAHQPVHWFAWGEAAFAAARAAGKPVLLDIGAAWCHWCHVMDAESYDDPAVAEALNRDFVCIKVDRDERPDVDARYQRAVQAVSGQGGWPLTAFLTPEGEVFFGGTYFPPEHNAIGRPGFPTVLREVAAAFHAEPDKIARNAQAVREAVTGALDESRAGAVTPALVASAADAMARAFDFRYGGFGDAPKFPHPAACEFLLARWHDTGIFWPREIVERTLGGMARGGVRDHLGGGFHRYAVDERWIVPHFEKMGPDNAALLSAYLAAFAAFGEPLYREVAAGIVDWVLETLCDRDAPAFYSSQDADAGPGDDGDYWTWTADEARAALTPEEFAVARRVFDVGPRGEMHHNPAKNVLWRREEPAAGEAPLLAAAVAKLRAARARRPAPAVDRTPYVAGNAMMAAAFLRAGAVLDREECNTIAFAVLERIWREAWDPARGMGHVLGRAGPAGMLDDHVHAAAAFLDAFEATGEARWRERAETLMRHCLAAHGDADAGGLWDVAGTGAAYLAHRAKPIQDSPAPSGNGVAALVLARLAAITDAAEWRDARDRQLAAFAGAAEALGVHGATFALALDWAVHPVTRVEVSGPLGPGAACAMHLRALQAWRPRRVVIRREAAAPAATVCVGTRCSLPVADPDALAGLLA